ncbi:MAG: hypothetical protein H0T60_08245 [Acidobacteria bacterium]|nr:hypothetical protein [Acidobacteriota bacterium]
MKSLLLFTLLSFIASNPYACSTPPRTAHSDAELTSLPPCNTALWPKTYGPMKRFGVPPTPQQLAGGANPYVRSVLEHRCVHNVKGTVKDSGEQPDGDYKLLIALDNSQPTAAQPPMIPLDRAKFYPDGNQRKWITAEIVCAATPAMRLKGKDASGRPYVYPDIMSPVKDHFCTECVEACMNYTNTIPRPRNGEVVYVTGELVKDTGVIQNPEWNDKSPPWVRRFILGHGHMEIHPVTAITK